VVFFALDFGWFPTGIEGGKNCGGAKREIIGENRGAGSAFETKNSS
jgi:hypothetical protein